MILNQNLIDYMDEYSGGQNYNFKSSRFTYQIDGLQSGEYSPTINCLWSRRANRLQPALMRFTVSSFEGSLPPSIDLSDPSDFGAITSTSVVPLTARGEDPDGALEFIHYYIDGTLLKSIPRISGLAETNQAYSTLLDINSTLGVGEERGFRSIFATRG